MNIYRIRDFSRYPDFPLQILRRDKTVLQRGAFYEGEHRHDFIEVVCIENGSGWMCLNGRIVPCFPGDIYIMPMKTVHEFKVLDTMRYYNLLIHPDAFSPAERAVLEMAPGFAESFLNPNGNPTFCRLPFPATAKLRMLLAQANEAANDAGACFRIRLKSCMLLIICEILALVPKSDIIAEKKRHGEQGVQNISEIVNYMTGNFQRHLTIAELAKHARMSSAGFIRFFRKQTGITPIQYLNKLRIFEACRMLKQRKSANVSISEIAYACGFSSSSYFAETFRLVLDISPSEYTTRDA